jgi:hypothetical protein
MASITSIRSEAADVPAPTICPATETPRDLELARRLRLLSDPTFDADCSHSIERVLITLLCWGVTAAVAWLVMQ